VLLLVVVSLPTAKNPFAVQLNNNNTNNYIMRSFIKCTHHHNDIEVA
jgi:hypothetical protein